jgi:integrase/recombinase XerD
LTDYFAGILDELSWSTLKCDLYGLKFYYAHVLDKPWPGAELTKAPKVSRLPDIVTVEQMQRIVDAARVLSYRVFFFVLYSMGLRLGEGLQLRVGDIDADRMRVHVRDAKGIPPPKPRPAASCACCGKPMRIVRTRVRGEVNTSRSMVPVRETAM